VKRRPERGFTLIELMVALVVSALLVGMILAIFSRMSLAYRGQQQIAGVQQVLAAARATIELDARQAGFAMPQGFRYAGDPNMQSPVQITNSNTGPDRVAFFYADASVQAVVTAVVGSWAATPTPTVTVDDTAGFAPGDLVVLSTADPKLPNPIDPANDAMLVSYDACILRIAPGGVVGTKAGNITFETVSPWGQTGSIHCTPPLAPPPSPPSPTIQAPMLYKFVAHAYRIDPDPARAAIGALQGSLVSGGLLHSAEDNWTDLAYGFTDIQTALRAYNEKSLVDADRDLDVTRNWISGGSPDLGTNTIPPFPDTLLQISISLVARTDRDVEGIATAATPQLIDPEIPDNNSFGDHPSVPLPSPTDPALQGSRVYRYTTFLVDLRNLGVGR